ncbi:MAG TPA: YhfC family glutamic-type intramembrane protease [Anaerolineae bacterium]|nr:YhfC family glutamic-type intramembrane protease [Anaerolineae bacterium]
MTLDPRLVMSYAVAIAFDIVFPLIVGYVIHRRYNVRWRFFLYGALVFLLSQIVTRVPLVQIAEALLATTLQTSTTILYLWLVVLAVTAGLFEEIGRYLGYRYLVKNDRSWQVGLMYGAGHGGLESMLLVGGLALLGLINVIALTTTNFSQMNLSSEQLAQIEQARQQIAALEWWMPLLGAYERFITIFFQIALSILVLQVFVRGSWLWLLLAIALHALVDLVAIILVQQIGAVGTEVALTLLLPVSFAIIYYFRPAHAPRLDTLAPLSV